jgi:hypothetical protein
MYFASQFLNKHWDENCPWYSDNWCITFVENGTEVGCATALWYWYSPLPTHLSCALLMCCLFLYLWPFRVPCFPYCAPFLYSPPLRSVCLLLPAYLLGWHAGLRSRIGHCSVCGERSSGRWLDKDWWLRMWGEYSPFKFRFGLCVQILILAIPLHCLRGLFYYICLSLSHGSIPGILFIYSCGLETWEYGCRDSSCWLRGIL